MTAPVSAPYIFAWLEWCLYAYWGSLFGCVLAVAAHKAYLGSQMAHPSVLIGSLAQASLLLFVAISLWVVLCAVRQGYAVG